MLGKGRRRRVRRTRGLEGAAPRRVDGRARCGRGGLGEGERAEATEEEEQLISYFKVTRHYLNKTHSTKSISHKTGMCGIEERVRSFYFFYSNIFISESIFLRSK